VSGYLDISGIAHVENVAVLSADPASTSYVQGNSGDNVIVGSAGNDHLSDATKGGSDRLYGRDGDDFLYLTRGGWQTGAESYVLDGGAGNDRMLLSLADWTQTASMIGGDGDDQFEIGRGAVVKVDGGAGDDRILLRDLGAAITITLGSGRDLIQFTTNTTFGDRGGSVVVTDFDFGGAGDRVEFVHYLRSVTTGWDPATNPFASQHLRLVQQGADAVLQRDSNGAAGGAAFVDMIRFAGVAAASLTHASLGGYHPDGSAPAGVTLNGTDGAESLWGTFRDDTIRGLGGDDRIDSGAGADRIEGGDGNDRLDGQFGDDVLFGEGGDDTLYETDGGNASLFGGAGKDAIIVEYAHGQAAATITMDGGADDDRLIFRGINRGGDTLSVSGGDGNDEIRITGFGTIDIDAGAGGDYLVLSSTAGLYSIALGGGRDTLVLENPWGNDTRLVFSDFFAAGPEAGGDILEMRKHLKSVLIGWDGVFDPFAGGFLRLTQKGADAVIEIDSDGTAGSGGYRELIRFQNGDAGALSAYNLDGLATFAINGSEDGETITAGAGDHQLNGLGGNDTLSGGAGKDRLDGGTGADTLRGGAGDDLFFVDDAGDLVVELAGEGVDEVRTALGSRSDPAKMYVMTANVEKFTGTSGSGQGVYGNASDNVMVMGAGADVVVLEGGGADTVFGNDGDDEFLFGNAFNNADKVDGGAGVDTLSLSGRYTLAFDADDVFGIEKLALSTSGNPAATFNYNLTMHDANVAAGGLLSVTGSSLTAAEKLIFNGAAETNGRFAVIGGAGADQLTGGAGNDTLEGRAGIDRLEGGAGDDRLDGGGAADTMIGGTGNDLYLVDSIRDVVTELAGEGLDEVRTALGSSADVTSTYLLPDHVENLTGTSTAGQRVSGNAQNNLITMGAGGDYVNLEGGGADQVFGNGGNDEFYWGSAFTNADRADGGAGVDTLRLRGTYTLTFDADDMFGIERLALSTSGNSAAPFSYNLTMHDANLAAGQQMTVVAQALGETETLVFNGSAETDGTFNIRGGKGADTITGGAGADQIFGNLGADLLRGGGGNDQFEYFSAAESTVAASDVIRDFTKGDRVNLTAIDADGDPTNGNSTFTWLGSGAFTKQAGQLRLFQHPEYTRSWGVEADIDGDGAADMLIYLVGPPGFVPDLSDFYL
jgi:Ca2+-binding RTX toxin-like protein